MFPSHKMVFLCYIWLVLVNSYLGRKFHAKIPCAEKVTANLKNPKSSCETESAN